MCESIGGQQGTRETHQMDQGGDPHSYSMSGPVSAEMGDYIPRVNHPAIIPVNSAFYPPLDGQISNNRWRRWV